MYVRTQRSLDELAEIDLCLGCCEEQRPGGDSQVQAVHNPRDEDGLQVPGVRHWRGNHTVLG